MSDPGAYEHWLDHVWPAACTRPVRLHGQISHVDPATGELLRVISTGILPDRVVYKPCGNRRVTACPGCAETYRRDAFHLIRAGLVGGKGVPDTVTAHPAVFATFTAPSFGPVHTRTVRTHTCMRRDQCRCQAEPCHARRGAGTCPAGCPYDVLDRRTEKLQARHRISGASADDRARTLPDWPGTFAG